MFTRGALAAFLMLAACSGAEQSPDIAITDARARATVPGQTSSAVYLTITNKGGDDRLVSVATAAGAASLHSTSMDGGVMRMRPLDGLVIPAGARVELKPGGTHIMLMGIKQPLAPGSTLPLDLKFERFGERRVTARVEALSGATM